MQIFKTTLAEIFLLGCCFHKLLKMSSHLAFTFINFFLFLHACSLVLAETGCPPAENVSPCSCDDRTSTRLTCSGLRNSDDFQKVFENSERYTFQEVHIKSSSFQYIPGATFDKVQVNEFYIRDSTFIALFDHAPKSNLFYKLQVDNCTVMRGIFNSDVLKNVTSLKTLIVDGVSVPSLGSSFSRNLPSSLTQITIRRSGLSKIFPGAFEGFPHLDKLVLSSSKLSNLTRNRFPHPFNVRFLYFDNNSISDIPEDLFVDMPHLQFLSMQNNDISEIPKAAFGYRRTNVPFLRFEENPLQCNCLLVWLVRDKPEILGGTCSSPNHLRGKQLQNLLPGDFNCY